MSEQTNSVDFWVDELTKDTDPEHFGLNVNDFYYTAYKHNYSTWMWNRGYNAGLVNLQTKVNTYCVPQWISVKDRLPDKDGKYMVWYGEFEICEFDADSQTFGYTYDEYDEMYSRLVCWDDYINEKVTHWMPLPEPPKENNDD